MLSTFQARCMLVSSLFIPNVLPVFNLGWVNLNTNQNYILLSVCTLKNVILIKYCTEHTQCKYVQHNSPVPGCNKRLDVVSFHIKTSMEPIV